MLYKTHVKEAGSISKVACSKVIIAKSEEMQQRSPVLASGRAKLV